VSLNLLSWPTKEWLWKGHIVMTKFEWDLVVTCLAPPITKCLLAMFWDIHELLIVEVIFPILLNKVKNDIIANLVSRTQFFFFSTLPNNGSRIKRKQRRWCMAQRSGIHCNQWCKGLLSSFFAHNLVHLFTNMLGCPCLFSLPRMEQSLVKKLFHLEGLHHNWQSKKMSQDEALWFWDLRPLFLQNV